MREGRALRGHLPNPVTSPHEPGPLALRRGVASGKRGVSPVSAPGLVGPPFTTGGCGWGEAWPEGTERRVGPVGAEGSAGLPPSWGTWKTGCLAVLSSGGAAVRGRRYCRVVSMAVSPSLPGPRVWELAAALRGRRRSCGWPRVGVREQGEVPS